MATDVKPNPMPITSPNLNGRYEKFIGTIKQECLTRFIKFGKKHLDYLISNYCDYYNLHHSHSRGEHPPSIREISTKVASLSLNQVVVNSHLGGLVSWFARKAA